MNFTPLWDGRLESGDWRNWNGWQIKTNTPLDQRVTIHREVDGLKPLPGLAYMAKIVLKPGDQSGGLSGVRSLAIFRPPGNGGHYTYQYPSGYDSSFTYALAFDQNFKTAGINLWNSGLEIHDSGSGDGPAPSHDYTWPTNLELDVNAGKDNPNGTKHNVLEVQYLDGWKTMQWYVFAKRYLHHPSAGAVQHYAANENDNAMKLVRDAKNIGTMFTDAAGKAIGNYGQFGVYASGSLKVTLTMYFCAFMEVPNIANALEYTTALLHGTLPDPPPPDPTNAELRDLADAEFRLTTDPYPAWVKKGKPKTHWYNGYEALRKMKF